MAGSREVDEHAGHSGRSAVIGKGQLLLTLCQVDPVMWVSLTDAEGQDSESAIGAVAR